MIFDFRVRVRTHDVHFVQTLYTFYFQANVTSGRDRNLIAHDLADALLLPQDWAMFLKFLHPLGTFLRNFEISTLSGLDIVTRQLGGPAYEGTRFFLFETLAVSFVCSRIRWFCPSSTKVHYSQFSYTWERDWDGDFLTGLYLLQLQNFAIAHTTSMTSPHGDLFYSCGRVQGGLLLPIFKFQVDRKFSRQLRRRKRI